MEDITELSGPMQKFGKVDSFGQTCMEMQRNSCSVVQDAKTHGNINSRDAMPLKSNLQVDIFDVWGVDFMGPFPMSEQCEYILVAVDYVSKWVEALPCVAADSRSSKKMFQEIIFPHFGVPRVVISDGGSHFIDRTFRKCLSELGVDHRVATPYHPQTSGQAKTSNKQSRTFCKRRSMPWGRAGKANYPRHYVL